MEDVCIRVLSQEHGKRVIKYFQSQGVDTHHFDGGSINNYYGVFNGEFNYDTTPGNSKVIELPENKLPRKMLVWNGNDKPVYRLVLWVNPNKNHNTQCISVRDGDENNFMDGDKFVSWEWEHYKEISTIEELTMEQVCKELGREVKIIK
jgi:hypothetical protein